MWPFTTTLARHEHLSYIQITRANVRIARHNRRNRERYPNLTIITRPSEGTNDETITDTRATGCAGQ